MARSRRGGAAWTIWVVVATCIAVVSGGMAPVTASEVLPCTGSDEAATAPVITGEYHEETGRLCAGEQHRWRFVVDGDRVDDAFSVSLSHESFDGGELHLDVVDGSGQSVAQPSGPELIGTGSHALRFAHAGGLAQGTYWIVVEGADEQQANHYHLSFYVGPDQCRLHEAEPNGTPETASGLPLGQSVVGLVCAGDRDRFAIPIPSDASGALVVTADHQQDFAPSLQVVDGAGNQVGTATSTDQELKVTVDQPVPGTTYTAVLASTDSSGAAYTLGAALQRDPVAAEFEQPPLTVTAFARATVDGHGSLRVFVIIQNTSGQATARGVEVWIADHQGLRVDGDPRRSVGDIAGGGATQAAFTLVPTDPCAPQTLTYTVFASHAGDAGDVGDAADVQVLVPATGPCFRPAPPTNVRTGSVGNGTVQLLWDGNPPNEDGYVVAYAPAGTGSYSQRDIGPDQSGWLHSSLVQGSRWTYWVRTCNRAGCSDWAGPVTVTATAPTPPATPTGLLVIGRTPTSLRVAWTDRSSDETSFQLAHAPNGQPYVFTDLAAGQTSYLDSGLASDVQHTYYVRACNAAGCSSWSNGAAGITQPPPAPAAPSWLRSAGTSASAIELQWTDNSSDEDHFVVAYSVAGADDYTYGRVSANGDSTAGATHRGLTNRSSWDYWVRACKTGDNCSAWVGPLRLTARDQTPTVPRDVRVSRTTSTTADIVWADSDVEDRYLVAVIPDGGAERRVELPAGTTTYQATGLPHGGGFSVWVAACRGTECSDWSRKLTGTTRSVTLTGLEVNQAVQDLRNSVTLVRDKDTIVRAHIVADGETAVSGQLRAYRSGRELSGSPLQPLNAWGRVTADGDADRGVLDSSLNFRIPSHWDSGTVRFVFEATSGTVTCDDVAGPTADDCSTTVTFRQGTTPEVDFFQVTRVTGTGESFLGQDTIDDLALSLAGIMPVPEIRYDFRAMDESFPAVPDLVDVNSELWWIRFWDECLRNCDTQYYGAVTGRSTASNDAVGLADGVPGRVSSGVFGPPSTGDRGFWRHTHSHEIAHVIGRPHAVDADNFTITEQVPQWWPLPPEERRRTEGYCGEVADADSPSFPNLHAVSGFTNGRSTSIAPTIGPMDRGADRLIYGLDTVYVGTGDDRAVSSPFTSFELMGYCYAAPNSPQGVWISDANYEAIFRSGWDLDVEDTDYQALAVDDALPREFLVVRGEVDITEGGADGPSGDVTLHPFARVTSTTPPEGSGPGPYALELRDADGAVLATTTFAPSVPEARELPQQLEDPDDPTTGGPSSAPFIVVLPIPEGPVASAVVVATDGQGQPVELATATASANAPDVSITAPAAGASLLADEATFAWTASDADGDAPLTAIVQYSPDAGATWTTLATSVTDGSHTVARTQLEGSDDARLRVVVSDGFHATTVDSERFSVADSAPRLVVSQPVDRSEYGRPQVLSLLATIDDVEDDAVTDEQVTWTSDRDGPLGSGRNVVRTTDDLSPGPHTITVTAVDSAGNTTTARRHIVVMDAETPDGPAPALAGTPPAADGTSGSLPLLDPDAGGDGQPPTEPRPPAPPAPPPADGGEDPDDDTPDDPSLVELGGQDRIATSVLLSRDTYADVSMARGLEASWSQDAIVGVPTTRVRAGGAVLARADEFPDALIGAPLATALGGPLLLTTSDRIDSRVADELRRILEPGMPVALLGGTSALSDGVGEDLDRLGFSAVRYGGADRYATAVEVAERGLGTPDLVLLATGQDFPDALSAGAAAAMGGGAVLLVGDGFMPSSTAEYVAAHKPWRLYAVGGPATRAAPGTPGLAGADRYSTATVLADALAPDAVSVGIASGVGFPDALAGGSHAAAHGAPILLTPPHQLAAATRTWIAERDLRRVWVYGGTTAIDADVRAALRRLLGG